MYLCKICGETFERHEVCPNCGGADYTEAIRCKRCGRWHDWNEFKDHFFCAECTDEIEGAMEDLFKFSPDCDEIRAREQMESEVREWLDTHW